MTRDEIAQAMQDTAGYEWGNEAHFQRFAKVILETEREECARVCEQEHGACWHASAMSAAKAAERCAEAIRART